MLTIIQLNKCKKIFEKRGKKPLNFMNLKTFSNCKEREVIRWIERVNSGVSENKPALQWFVEREFKKVKDMRD